jgi:hypothetical protein
VYATLLTSDAENVVKKETMRQDRLKSITDIENHHKLFRDHRNSTFFHYLAKKNHLKIMFFMMKVLCIDSNVKQDDDISEKENKMNNNITSSTKKSSTKLSHLTKSSKSLTRSNNILELMDNAGTTPLEIALKRGHFEFAEMTLDYMNKVPSERTLWFYALRKKQYFLALRLFFYQQNERRRELTNYSAILVCFTSAMVLLFFYLCFAFFAGGYTSRTFAKYLLLGELGIFLTICIALII